MSQQIPVQRIPLPPPGGLKLREKLWHFFPAVRQRLRPRRHLIAGPYLGEFGFELMQWQGYVRARRPHYETVHVLTYPGRDYLYEGCHVHYHDLDLKNAGYGYGWTRTAQLHATGHELARQLGLQDYDVFNIAHLGTRYHKMLCWRQDFRLFREAPKSGGMRDIAFHFRAVDKAGPDQTRNYRLELASELVARGQAAGWRMLCIGHPAYSACPDGIEDCRSLDLRETISALCSVRLIVGELSGPLHLANLCGQPTAFFADGQWRIDHSLRWNPFRVPLYVITNETMQPSSELVFNKTQEALADLSRHTAGFTQPCHTLPAQPISRV